MPTVVRIKQNYIRARIFIPSSRKLAGRWRCVRCKKIIKCLSYEVPKKVIQDKKFNSPNVVSKTGVNRRVLNNAIRAIDDPVKLLRFLQQYGSILHNGHIEIIARSIADFSVYTQHMDIQNDEDFRTSLMDSLQLLITIIHKNLYTTDIGTLTMCIWSLAKTSSILELDVQDQNIQSVFSRMCLRVAEMDTRGMLAPQVSAILWSMALFGWSDQQTVERLAEVAKSVNILAFRAFEVQNILWAFTVLKVTDIRIVARFSRRVKWLLPYMDAQRISSFLFCLGVLRFCDGKVIQIVGEILLEKQMKLSCNEIMNVLLYFAEFAQVADKPLLCDVFDFLIQQFVHYQQISPQVYVNVLYALAIINYDITTTQQIVDKMIASFGQDYEIEFCDGLFQKLRRIQLQYLSCGQHLIYPEELENKCVEKWRLKTHEKSLIPNRVVNNIYSIIQMKFSTTRKFVTILDGELKVEIEIIWEDKKIAVMPRMPNAYSSNMQRLLMGSTRSYFDMLEGFGWSVVKVSITELQDKYFEYNILNRIESVLKS